MDSRDTSGLIGEDSGALGDTWEDHDDDSGLIGDKWP